MTKQEETLIEALYQFFGREQSILGEGKSVFLDVTTTCNTGEVHCSTENINDESWVINIKSDKCPYCLQKMQADDDYLCQHNKNYGKECCDGLCPIIANKQIIA